MKRISVLLADDHTLVREGIRALLELESDLEVVGEAADGCQAVEMARELRPAVVVMDIAMPQLNGLEAARRILDMAAPPSKVLMLSAHGDEAYITQVTQLGVQGYLVKQSSGDILARAIRAIHKGKTYYSPSIAKRLVDHSGALPSGRRSAKKNIVHLTSRERQVLQLVAEGRANKQVAADLGVSVKTVEKHRQSIMDKLGIHDTAGLTRYAISAGIVESSVQCTILL